MARNSFSSESGISYITVIGALFTLIAVGVFFPVYLGTLSAI